MKLVKVVAIIAAILLVISGVVVIATKLDKDVDPPSEIPTPNQLVYGISYAGEIGFDIQSVKKYILQDQTYAEYTVRDEYTMVYQITNEEKELKVKDILGIKEELPKVDYDEEYLLVSTGKKITDLNDKTKKIDSESLPIVDFVYSSEPYAYGSAFVYKMNARRVSSGETLEYYLWENASSESNLVFDDSFEKEILSEGKYHTMYLRSDGKYVYRLYDARGEEIKKRAVLEEQVNITEHGDTIIEIEKDGRSVYYNPQKNLYSEEYLMPTEYLIYNIIYYVRLYDGEIQLILRDAYDKLFYAKIVRLPFTDDKENLHELVKSVEVIDDTSVWVEYYKGEKRELVREVAEVYNLKR